VFQIFGAQPALAVAERATRNIVEGQPVTEGLGEAYGQGVVGTAIPALGHKVVSWLLPEGAPSSSDGGVARTSGDVLGPPSSSEQASLGAGLGRSELDAVADSSVAGDLGQTKNGDIGSRRPVLADSEVVSRDSGTQPLRSDTNGFKGRGVWDLPATKRGRILEKIFGHNLHPNHPTIDIWDPNTGAATSLKSIDLETPIYQPNGKYANALYNKLSKAVNELADFEGGRYASDDVPEDEIASRTLTVIVPSLGTAEQRQVLRRIAKVGSQRGVMVRVEVYR
jgi:hypothetical protein